MTNPAGDPPSPSRCFPPLTSPATVEDMPLARRDDADEAKTLLHDEAEEKSEVSEEINVADTVKEISKVEEETDVIDTVKDKGQVDFDDKSSWEYLFKDYYTDLKGKLSLIYNELAQAKNPWKGSDIHLTSHESPGKHIHFDDEFVCIGWSPVHFILWVAFVVYVAATQTISFGTIYHSQKPYLLPTAGVMVSLLFGCCVLLYIYARPTTPALTLVLPMPPAPLKHGHVIFCKICVSDESDTPTRPDTLIFPSIHKNDDNLCLATII